LISMGIDQGTKRKNPGEARYKASNYIKKYIAFFTLMNTDKRINRDNLAYTISNIYQFGSRLEAPKVANGIEPTLVRSSTQYIPATIHPSPRRPDNYALTFANIVIIK